jgi:hypothetical protein
MTDLLDPPVEPIVDPAPAPEADAQRRTPSDGVTEDDLVERVTLSDALRPLLVAGLATLGAGLMTGGIFGSWTARGLATISVLVGVGWAFLAYRSRLRLALQAGVVPVAFVLGTVALLPTKEGPTGVLGLMTDAVSAGRLLRPPVPFDAGWRPIITVVFVVTGFGAAWLALALKRPQMGLLLPVPILLLTGISQPAEGQLLGAILGFMPVLLALGVLFGGDRDRTSDLSGAFELKRLLRAVPMAVGALVLLFLLSQTSFLFPDSVYDPTDKPQKPKAIPLGQVQDRVLFEVKGDITGPWRVGVFDVYDGQAWRIPPFDKGRFQNVPGDGLLDDTRPASAEVTFTIRDLGNSSVLPGVSDPVHVGISGVDVLYDPRTGGVRMAKGRIPAGLEYTESLGVTLTPEQLRQYGPDRDAGADQTSVPPAPANVQALLDQAPGNPWDRLEVLRKKLNQDVVAVGAGDPSKAVPVSKVDDLLFGSKEGSPYEIVAAEALLARWAGWPARVGFGFDKFNDEAGIKTVRPKNGSSWLEIDVEGAGWTPVIGAPPKAKSSLDTDPNARFDETIVPSDDVAVELLVPVKVENLRLLYERIRAIVLASLPVLAALLAVYVSLPAIRRAVRRRKRHRWAAAMGPRAAIAVEYAELRDALYDLNVGDPFDTPLEYLQRCAADEEHEELAWLVTRATYGDLAFSVTAEHADIAAELAHSVRRRIFAAQPFQSRVLAWLSRESLRRPFTTEVPNIRMRSLGGLHPRRAVARLRTLSPLGGR